MTSPNDSYATLLFLAIMQTDEGAIDFARAALDGAVALREKHGLPATHEAENYLSSTLAVLEKAQAELEALDKAHSQPAPDAAASKPE